VASQLLRLGDLQLVLVAQEGRPPTAHTADTSATGASDYRREGHEASIIGFLHGVLAGWDIEASLGLAQRLAGHAAEHPGLAVPEELLQRG
jgi:hypothetical protein